MIHMKCQAFYFFKFFLKKKKKREKQIKNVVCCTCGKYSHTIAKLALCYINYHLFPVTFYPTFNQRVQMYTSQLQIRQYSLFTWLWPVHFSTPEHTVLMVSYCDQSMSDVRHVASTIALKAYSSYTPGPMDSKLGRKHKGDLKIKSS